ncbi:type IX secretion system membrane protein PorP/SprF, partial [Bacteroides caecimuris]|uniref:type IX secretion system membrane protein PorP/SprF n=1 Tax=Bacteroides caecimuris TaxID=1796613 RepID=UPI002647CF3D
HPTQREKFQFSLLGRSTGEFGFLAGVKLLSEMKILCSYDYNMRSLKSNTKGTFEVIVTYPLFPRKCVADGFRR